MSTVHIHCLFFQELRNIGDLIPELLVAWDEFSVDANGEGWDKACADAKASRGPGEYRRIDLIVKEEALKNPFVAAQANALVRPAPDGGPRA